MAMTQLALLFIGGIALLASLGLFYNFDDPWTGVLVGFVAAGLWGLFGISSMDVIVRDSAWASASRPIDPLMWVGFALAVLTAFFAIYDLLQQLNSDAQDADLDTAMR